MVGIYARQSIEKKDSVSIEAQIENFSQLLQKALIETLNVDKLRK